MTACSQAWNPASAARYFAALAAAPQDMLLSYCQDADMVISQAASSSIQFFASGCWIAWFLPIWPVEDDAALCVVGGAVQRDHAEADGFGRDQDALGIHPVQDVFEAAAFLADPVLHRNLEILEEQLVGVDRLAAHLLDLARVHALAIEVGIEES